MAGFNKMRQRTFYATDKLRNLSRRQRDLVRALRESGEEEYTVTGYVTSSVIEEVQTMKNYEDDNEETVDEDDVDEYELTVDKIETIINQLSDDYEPDRAELGRWLDDKWRNYINSTKKEERIKMLSKHSKEILSKFDEMVAIGYVGNKVHGIWESIEALLEFIPAADYKAINRRISSFGEYNT